MRKRSFCPAYWLFILTFVVRLFVVDRLSQARFFIPTDGDMKFYSDWALRIAQGVLTDHKAFYGLPGYSYFLAGLYRILNFDKYWVSLFAGLIQSLADAFTAVLIWRLATEAFGGGTAEEKRRAGVIGVLAGVGWAFYQPSQVFTAILMPTALAVAAFWFCVWQVTKRRAGGFSVWAPWLPIGLLIGVQAMIVATILFVVPLALAAIVAQYRRTLISGDEGGSREPVQRFQPFLRHLAKPATAAALLIAGVFVGAAPCWIHNYFLAGEPVMLSAHSGLNFYIGNNAEATGYPRMPAGMSASQQGMLKDSITIAEAAEGRPLKHYEVSQYWSAKAHEYIAANRAEWLRLMGHKFVNFWNSFQYDDLSLITLFDNAGIITPGLRFGWVAALAIPGMLLAIGRRRAWWITAAVLLHMAALMPVFVTERYRLAAVPGLLLLAAYGVYELWAFLEQARWIPATAYACGGLAAAFFVATPPAQASLWSLDHYNTGVAALNDEDYPVARRELEMAYRYVPQNSEINFALGLYWQEQGNAALAKGFYGTVLTLNPRHEAALSNLGVLAGKEKAWDVATRFFAHALEIDPQDAKAEYLQARAYAELGKWDSAQSSIDSALKLEPKREIFQKFAGLIATRGPLPEE